MKLLANFAWKEAKKSANSACPWLLYTPKLPDKVKKMRKY